MNKTNWKSLAIVGGMLAGLSFLDSIFYEAKQKEVEIDRIERDGGKTRYHYPIGEMIKGKRGSLQPLLGMSMEAKPYSIKHEYSDKLGTGNLEVSLKWESGQISSYQTGDLSIDKKLFREVVGNLYQEINDNDKQSIELYFKSKGKDSSSEYRIDGIKVNGKIVRFR